MGDTWITDLTHFLDEEGRIGPTDGPARKLAEHFTAIVEMASRPELIVPPEHLVRCRRRPGRKPCIGHIEIDLDFENEDIIWWCTACDDHGFISNWKGSKRDLSGVAG